MEELNFQPELVELRCIKFIGGKGGRDVWGFSKNIIFSLANNTKTSLAFWIWNVSLYWKRFNNKFIFSLSIFTIPRVIK